MLNKILSTKVKERLGKIVIGFICALSMAATLLASAFFGAKTTFGDEKPTQKPFKINEFNAVNAQNKNEVVTGLADANGHVYEIKDKITLSGIDAKSTYIKDKTNLTDIENISGDEKLEVHDGYVYFENKNKNVMYEGTGKEKMPVGVNVSYFLDGQKLSPEKIAGKSGHVIIRFDYTNSTLDSEYVPYIAMSAVVLNSEKFSNIKSNVNVMNVGDDLLVYGGTIPGFSEFVSRNGHGGINVSVENFVQIEADTTNFSVEYTYTVFSNGFSNLTKDERINQADSFADGSEDLGKSVKDLSTGISSLAGEIENLVSGLGDYQTSLENYATKISELNEKIADLNSKLAFMPELSATLDSIVKYLEQLEGYASYVIALKQIINENRDGLKRVIDKYFEDPATEKILKNLVDLIADAPVDEEDIKGVIQIIEGLIEKIANEVDGFYEKATQIGEGLDELEELSSGIADNFGILKDGFDDLQSKILNSKSLKIDGNTFTKSDNLRYFLNSIRQMKQSDEKYFPYSGADENVTGEITYLIKTDGF